MTFEIGRICLKIAGRDANRYCVIVNTIDKQFVEIDGQTRRRKCNVNHLEPLAKTIDIKKGASNSIVAKALSDAGFATEERKESKKTVSAKPVKQRVNRKLNAPAETKADVKKAKAEKKVAKPVKEEKVEVSETKE
jgi:large subunit ribosomal protein L14e